MNQLARRIRKPVAALMVVPILVFWFMVVHQDDEILALVRNEVVDVEGQRAWVGSFVNTNKRTLRDVAVTVDLLDEQNRTVAKSAAQATELLFGNRLDLQAPLPPEAVRMRIYSVQWRMDRTAVDRWLHRASGQAQMGPFREPWEFGYLMTDPAAIRR